MAGKLRVPDAVAATLRGLHPQLKRKLRGGLDALLEDPHAGKALKDELAVLWSLRVGRFRIIYRLTARQFIELVAIGPRERIYEETYRLLRKEARKPRG